MEHTNITKIFAICFFSLTIVADVPAIRQTLTGNGNPADKTVQLLVRGKRLEAAISMNESLGRIYRGATPSPARDYLTLSILWNLCDSTDRAAEAYNIYIEGQINPSPDRNEAADRLLWAALILNQTEQFQQAADSLVKSLVLRSDTSLFGKIMEAESSRFLARLNKKTGDRHEALRNFNRSLEINRSIQRTACIADDLTDMSIVISGIDKMDNLADQALYEALDLYRQLGEASGVSTVYNELGVLFVNRSSMDTALAYVNKSLAIKKGLPEKDSKGMIAVLNNIGTVYFYKQRKDSADYFFSRILNLAEAGGINPATYYTNIGVLYASKGDLANGLKYFQRALSCLDTLCDPDDLDSNPHVSVASPQLAEYTSYKAHAFNKRYLQTGDRQDLVKGLETYKIALGMMDTLRFLYSFDSKPLLGQEFKIHYFQALEMALDLYQVSGSKEFLDLAFQLSGRNKSATLNEFIRTNQARKYLGANARWITEEDSLKQALNKLHENLIKQNQHGKDPDKTRSDIRNSIIRTTDRLISLQSRIRLENPDLYRLIYSNQGYPPDTIRKMLKPDEALLDYTMTDSSYLIVFTLTRDTISFFRDTLGKSFFNDIKAFNKTITSDVSSENFKDFIVNANRMYNNLVAPVGIPGSIKKLIILPDEEIGFLPFEIFLADTIRPAVSDFSCLHYLNRRYAISYTSSHEQFYVFRNMAKPSRSRKIIAIAPFTKTGISVDSFTLPALKHSETEIRMMSKEFRTRRFIGSDADEEKVYQAFGSHSIVQLSTHGILNLEKPMQSRLLLSSGNTDGNLYLFEMLSMKVRSPLVVLNACNTGTGKLQVGEGIMSMSKALQFAGVPSLVTTLWPVDDRSSAKIMAYFYKNLRKGMDRRDALQTARNEYIDKVPLSVSSPYFWAGQVLIGDPGPLELKRSFRVWHAGLILLAFAGFFSIFYFNRKK
jgi:CHAT domain-containing protein/tetratricopeptide (TPR) repeat protein